MAWHVSAFDMLTQLFGQRALAGCLMLLLVTKPSRLSLAMRLIAQNTVHQPKSCALHLKLSDCLLLHTNQAMPPQQEAQSGEACWALHVQVLAWWTWW